jgi:hypothetical protein
MIGISLTPHQSNRKTMSKQIDKPVLAHTYCTKLPRVAELGKGVSDLASAQTAQDARCDASPVTCGKRDPHRDGRTNLLVLLVALDASPLSLRRDFWRGMGRRGDHAIHGKRGHIYPDGDGYLLCIGAQSARLWSAAKRKLSFCQLRIDGEDEGTLHLDRLPSPAEAKAIRHVVGLRKRRRPSGEARPGLDHRYTPDIRTLLAPHIRFSG